MLVRNIMAANIDHPCFKQPENTNARLWKYMDFTKFVSLISSSNIFLCRSDLFKDPYEGSFPKGNINLKDQLFSAIPPEHRENVMKRFYDHAKWSRQWTYISCWHMNQHESAAMWDLYAKTEEAIAIETTYDKLMSSLPNDSLLGLVNYIDYENSLIPMNNAYYPYMNKRMSFEHEKEARIVMQKLPLNEGGFDINLVNDKSGEFVNVDLNHLIDNIYVSPSASDWLTDLVAEVSKKYSLNASIIKSNLYVDPVF